MNKSRETFLERYVKTGINDIATLRPDLVKFLKNPEDAKEFTPGSHRKVMCKCPDCGYKKEVIVKNLCKYGFSCPVCGDGASFPNKVLRELLNRLPILNIEYEFRFDGSLYRYDGKFEYAGQKYLIEMDGAYHYVTNTYSNAEEVRSRDKLKNKLAEENGYKMIRIHCYPETMEHIKENLFNSDLNKLFDLSSIDWIEIESIARSNIIKRICDYYNEHPKALYKDIGEKFGYLADTISEFISIGEKLGWCKKENRTWVKIKYTDTITKDSKDFKSIKDCEKYLKEIGKPLRSNMINKRLKKYNGKAPKNGKYPEFIFEYID